MQPRKLIAIHVDPDLCVGSGLCVAADPGSFAMQPDGYAAYVGDVLRDAARAETVLDAAETCPVSAIRLEYDG